MRYRVFVGIGAMVLAVSTWAGGATQLSKQLYQQITSRQNTAASTLQVNQQGVVTSWNEVPGLFRSAVHFNMVGQPGAKALLSQIFATIMRKNMAIPDNNFFVTAWTLNSLIVANNLDMIQLSPLVLSQAITAEGSFLDQNHPNTALTSFWPQQLLSGQPVGYQYVATPKNLVGVLTLGLDGLAAAKVACLLTKNPQACQQAVASLERQLNNYKDAFHIPADTDDTSLNFALGADLLHSLNLAQQYGQQSRIQFYQQAYQQWQQSGKGSNTAVGIGQTLAVMVANMYQPSASGVNNLIDPRTYYVMQGINQSQPFLPSNVANVLLPTTWMMTLNDEKAENPQAGQAPLVAMPFNVNNVDATVLANFLYGVVSLDRADDASGHTLLSDALNAKGVPSTLSSSVNQAALSASRYIQWVLVNNIVTQRPDLVLTYYPSIYNFYWFVARSYAALKTYNTTDTALLQVQQNLTPAVAQISTNLLNSVHHGKVSGLPYWRGFLGGNNALRSDEDGLYSTALALNTLLDIWTVPVKGSQRYAWNPKIPANVQALVKGAMEWLVRQLESNLHTMNKSNPHGLPANLNAFFSGSVKGMSSLPFFFPANTYQDLDGTSFKPSDPSKITPAAVVGVAGLIAPSQYTNMLNQSYFGVPVPKQFGGYNQASSAWPFWSAPVLTYAYALQALATYSRIIP